MPITAITASGFKVLPPPRRVQTFAPKASPADKGSLDEKTQLIIDQITDEANQLDNEEMRDLWLDAIGTFKGTGDIEALIKLTEYRRQVIPLDEFIFSESYLGLVRNEVFPGLLEAAIELDSGKYVEAVLKGALGYGKSYLANIMMARGIYKISCMRHPQSSFGLASGTALVFTVQSVRLSTAKKAIFDELGKFIKDSPYFRHVYPFDPLITSQMIFNEQRLTVMPVSSSMTSIISMNVVGGILDEMNFMNKVLKSKSQNAELDGSYNQARNMYNAIARRRKSRFVQKGRLPGLLFLISSSRFPDDFTELKAAESTMLGGPDSTIFVMSKAVWEVKSRDTFMDEEFRVMPGTATFRSRVLRPEEEVPEDCRVISVPMDFYQEFLKDTDGALQEFAGITTMATRPFITRRSAISECMAAAEAAGYVNPFREEQYNFAHGIPRPDPDKLKTNIKIFRAAHIDLGLKRDAAGIAIGHIAGQRLIERVDAEGNKMTELMPVIGYDVILRVVPPPGGEIEFAQIREFLIMLRDQFNLPIEYVTLDGFQSVDFKQILKTKNFKPDHLSVEKVEPYRTMRDALYDTRLLIFPHQFLAGELSGLEWVHGVKTDDKVDHRANGTKDVADAVCGVATFLLRRRLAWSQSFDKYHSHLQKPPEQQTETLRNDVMRKETARKATFRKNVLRR